MAVTLHTTSGDIKLELYCEECPKACENFLALCASGYYKNNIFHRNIKDFMIQTGDPTGLGKGGNSIWGVPFDDELNPDLKHDRRGVLSMANNGPNTNKSQFFITYAKQPHLDLKYTIFGRVIDGFETLDELETVKVDAKYRPVVEQRYYIFFHAFSLKFLIEFVESRSMRTHSLIKPIISSRRPFSTGTQQSEMPINQRVKQMQEYFNQYVEEYYEVDFEQEQEERAAVLPRFPPKEELRVETLDDVVELLKTERVVDIVVISLGKDGPGHIDTIVIGSPFNNRHGLAVSETLRKAAQQYYDGATKRSVRNSFGWFQVTIGQIQIHIIGEEVRARFDLESLWSGAEIPEEDNEIPAIPPPRQ